MSDGLDWGVPDETPADRHAFLVVDDDTVVAKSLARLLEGARPCALAHTVEDALALLETKRSWCGFLLDLRLGARNGFEILEVVRRRYSRAPALMLTGHEDRAALNRAYSLGAGYILKPAGGPELARFVAEALSIDVELGPTLQHAACLAAAHYRLSPAETAILVLALRHEPVDRILARRGVTKNTHKTQTRTLLEKMNASSLREACWHAMALNRSE
jgi:DNA-binding NarL/FixJ family response regulator